MRPARRYEEAVASSSNVPTGATRGGSQRPCLRTSPMRRLSASRDAPLSLQSQRREMSTVNGADAACAWEFETLRARIRREARSRLESRHSRVSTARRLHATQTRSCIFTPASPTQSRGSSRTTDTRSSQRETLTAGRAISTARSAALRLIVQFDLNALTVDRLAWIMRFSEQAAGLPRNLAGPRHRFSSEVR
jgi:hypothetical protein